MNKSNIIKCLWLNTICNHSPKLIHDCLEKVGSAQEIFDGEIDELIFRRLRGFNLSEYKKKDLTSAIEIYDYCEKNSIKIVQISDSEYPQQLLNIDVPPHILYIKGENIDLNNYLSVSVVGTRNASEDGIIFTRKLCFDIAKAGVVIVSGMASGLDSAAHIGAISAGQKTVAVLAGGVDVIYPPKNKILYDAILKCGAVISERPPETNGDGSLYQERNRIIAGLSKGTVIVEGKRRSGTSITAKHAQEYNRDVFVVPGKPSDSNAFVPNTLLRDGAIPLIAPDDILCEYADVYSDLLDYGIAGLKKQPININDYYGDDNAVDLGYDKVKSKKNVKKQAKKPEARLHENGNKIIGKEMPDFGKYTESEQKILKYLYKNSQPVHIDEIINATGLSSSQLVSTALILQMKGAIKQHAGNLYTICNGG